MLKTKVRGNYICILDSIEECENGFAKFTIMYLKSQNNSYFLCISI